jgi:DNA sulfur modification protein DndC
MELMEQIKSEMRQVYVQDEKPIVVAFSGGKDSSLMLTLLWDVLLELPENLRNKTVHIMSSNTGVEVPVMEEYLERTLMKIEREAAKQSIPIQVHRVKPNMKNNFWVRTLRKGDTFFHS